MLHLKHASIEDRIWCVAGKGKLTFSSFEALTASCTKFESF